MVCDRNRLLVQRLDAGESVASLCAEFQLTRARIYELAAKVRLDSRRASRAVASATPASPSRSNEADCDFSLARAGKWWSGTVCYVLRQ